MRQARVAQAVEQARWPQAAEQAALKSRQTEALAASKRLKAKLEAQADEMAKTMPKTAFGLPTVPLKPARLAAPERADKVQTNGWN